MNFHQPIERTVEHAMHPGVPRGDVGHGSQDSAAAHVPAQERGEIHRLADISHGLAAVRRPGGCSRRCGATAPSSSPANAIWQQPALSPPSIPLALQSAPPLALPLSPAAESAPILFEALLAAPSPFGSILTDELSDRVPTSLVDRLASIDAGDPHRFLDDANAAALLDGLAPAGVPHADSSERQALGHVQADSHWDGVVVDLTTERHSPSQTKRQRRAVSDAVHTAPVVEWADWAPTYVVERMLTTWRRDPQEFLDPDGTMAVFDALDGLAAANDAEKSSDLIRFIVPAAGVDGPFLDALLRDVTVATPEIRILAHLVTAAAIPSPIAAAATDMLRHLSGAAEDDAPPALAYGWITGLRRRRPYDAKPFSRIAALHLVKDVLSRQEGDIEPAAGASSACPWRPSPNRHVLPATTAAYLAGRRLSTLEWGEGPRGANLGAMLRLARMYLRSAVLPGAFTPYGGSPDNLRRWTGALQRQYERRYGEKLLAHHDNAPHGVHGGLAYASTNEMAAIDALGQTAVVSLSEIRMLAHIGSAASIPDEVTWGARAVLRHVAHGPHHLQRQARMAEARTQRAQVHSMEGGHRFTRLAVLNLLRDVLTRRGDDIDTAGHGWRPVRTGHAMPEAFRLLLVGRTQWHPDDDAETVLAGEGRALRVARAYLRAGIPLVDVLRAGSAKRTLVTWGQGILRRSEQGLGERLLQAMAVDPPLQDPTAVNDQNDQNV